VPKRNIGKLFRSYSHQTAERQKACQSAAAVNLLFHEAADSGQVNATGAVPEQIQLGNAQPVLFSCAAK